MTSTPHDEDEHALTPGRRERAASWAGLRQPVVIVLLLIAFFSSISGKPLDGLLMLIVAAGLAWDARQHSGEAVAAARDGAVSSSPRPSSRHRRYRVLAGLVLVAAGTVYAVTVGSYIRFSWPATFFVVGLGAVVVAIGWHGPVRSRPDPGPLPRTGAALWFGVLVVGALCELWSLAHQPSLDTDSFAHPTISALSDPLLASHPGRSLVLGVWLLLGWYLVRR